MVTCILLAGGKGIRASNRTPKQFIEIGGKPIFTYSLHTLMTHKKVDQVVMVCHITWQPLVEKWLKTLGLSHSVHFADPGESRQHSIKNGLIVSSDFMTEGDLIMVHDAARPLINPSVINDVIKTASQYGSALPVLPIYDGVYTGPEGQLVTGMVQTKMKYHGQTPVCLDYKVYSDLNMRATDEQLTASKGTCSLLLNEGIHVRTVVGDPMTYKLTSNEDIIRFRELITASNATSSDPK